MARHHHSVVETVSDTVYYCGFIASRARGPDSSTYVDGANVCESSSEAFGSLKLEALLAFSTVKELFWTRRPSQFVPVPKDRFSR